MNKIRVHRILCGSLCPIGYRLMPGLFPPQLVCQCLLVETPTRLVLVDTGLGRKDMEDPKRLGITSTLLGPQNDPASTAWEQIKKLGYSPSDVTDVIPTHLDWDHAGGIADFPQARIHVMRGELAEAQTPVRFQALHRYRLEHVSEKSNWVLHEFRCGPSWFGFDALTEENGLPEGFFIINASGHTRNHIGVAIQQGDRWLLHAGDAYYKSSDLNLGKKDLPQSPFGLRIVQLIAHMDKRLARQTLEKISALRENSKIKIICGHDASEWSE